MRRLAPALLLALGCCGCGPQDPKDSSFSGTWSHTLENMIMGKKDESTITVDADREKFRIVTRAADAEIVEIYDGKTFASRTAWLQAELPPSETSRTAASYEFNSRRFWLLGSGGRAQPGGMIAGREALLYAISEKRPDGELSEQRWVDARTGVMLKRIFSVYSSQVSSLVTQESWECRTIDFRVPSPELFRRL